MARDWEPILDTAAAIVAEYPYQITLRQLHYRLVMTSGLGYRNIQSDYKQLSARTAEGRRDGSFPPLLDQTREIYREPSWTSPGDALRSLADQYQRDRTEDQDCLVVIAGEKATLLAQLSDWFAPLGVPIVLTRGYGSQTYLDDVASMVHRDGRDAILIYAGDLDPSGEDILRDFTERCYVWDKVEQVAVRPEQIAELGLVVNEGKASDSRAGAFVDRHRELGLVQVEVEAIPPDVLRELYTEALAAWWDESKYQAVMEQERVERDRLKAIAADLDD
jgi:hypothetical protein